MGHKISANDQPQLDLSTLASCNHTIIDYGTFGQWAAVLAGGRSVWAIDYSAKPRLLLIPIFLLCFYKSGMSSNPLLICCLYQFGFCFYNSWKSRNPLPAHCCLFQTDYINLNPNSKFFKSLNF